MTPTQTNFLAVSSPAVSALAGLAALLQAHDLRAAAISVGRLHLFQFLGRHAAHPLGRLEQRLQILDQRGDFLVFGLDLLALQSSQPAQLQIEDGIGLELGQLEAFHQPCPRRIDIRGVADQADDLIQILQGDQVAFEDVGPLAGFCQIEFRRVA